MEDAVRPRIALPGWWVRRRLVRAAAAPSAMRTAAYVALRRRDGGAERREDGRGKNPRTRARAGQQGRGSQGEPINHQTALLFT